MGYHQKHSKKPFLRFDNMGYLDLIARYVQYLQSLGYKYKVIL